MRKTESGGSGSGSGTSEFLAYDYLHASNQAASNHTYLSRSAAHEVENLDDKDPDLLKKRLGVANSPHMAESGSSGTGRANNDWDVQQPLVENHGGSQIVTGTVDMSILPQPPHLPVPPPSHTVYKHTCLLYTSPSPRD